MVNIKRLPSPILESYEWQWDGACMGVDSSVFFSPEAERGAKRQRREEAAKALCATCPVIEQCREHALRVQEPYGVWGGLTESERAKLLEQRVAS
ncbi:WhiB family transcriptional regulator [Aeromicrobium phragmitis]|uniref:Transcriptional regulator WhiB n=2 Tax=Aeromicrobium TaxID=2040 RepID=A0A3N6WNN4_9ACTN|nr:MULTISPECIES: WhiB family transcriptional regulator [Aeromicrobium]RLV57320.1 WhiB family transcriptional regulator [Aeromicrobium phragmitis]RQN09059.1 WhiB family transcriptional regulator [Aeromicrobium camelliae]